MPKTFVIEVAALEYARGGSVPQNIDHLFGIQGNLQIFVDGREWFNQPMFPVVELAVAANGWLRQAGEFEFETMEADERPFLWVRQVTGGCAVGAAWQVFPIETMLPCAAAIREALRQFVETVLADTQKQLGIDVSYLLSGAG
jgi:hypothetical protein